MGKNGDRWTILNLDRTNGLTLRHTHNGRTIQLPAAYVQESAELGYATTVHTAQGVTADTMHGIITGEESRQQLYTMLTRAAPPTTSMFRWLATETRMR